MKRMVPLVIITLLLALAASLSVANSAPGAKLESKAATCRTGNVPLPKLPKGSGYLHDVEAISPKDVWTVGYFAKTNLDSQNLVLHWDGKRLKSVSLSKNWVYSRASQVSALPNGEVWIMGEYANRRGRMGEYSDLPGRLFPMPPPTKPFVLRLKDGRWSSIPLPPRTDFLQGFTLDYRGRLWLGGVKRIPNATKKNLGYFLLQWQGRRWKKFSPPQGVDEWGGSTLPLIPWPERLAILPGPEFLVAASYESEEWPTTRPALFSWDGRSPMWHLVPVALGGLGEVNLELQRIAVSGAGVFIIGEAFREVGKRIVRRISLGHFVLKRSGTDWVLLPPPASVEGRDLFSSPSSEGGTWLVVFPGTVFQGIGDTWQSVTSFPGLNLKGVRSPGFWGFDDVSVAGKAVWFAGSLKPPKRRWQPLVYRLCFR